MGQYTGDTEPEQLTGAAHLVPLAHGWSLWKVAAVRAAGLPFELLDAFAAPRAVLDARGPDREEELVRISSAAVDEALCDTTFRTALTWQNPAVLRNWAAGYAAGLQAGGAPVLSRRRRKEVLIARYAQRYCAKNETVGFYGPVTWASLTGDAPETTARGTAGIRRSEAHFETWAMEALADAWRRDPRLTPLLPVRLDPACSFDGSLLRRPHRSPQTVDGLSRAILCLLDGRRTLGEVADLAAAADGRTPEAAVELLLRLHEQGVIQARFRVPCDARPERHLREQAAALPPGALRAELLAEVDALTALKDTLSSVAPRELLAAIDRVDAALGKATGSRTPAPSRQYGRTPVYLDCRRDLDVVLGSKPLDQLREPLAIVLDSARWLAAEIAVALHRDLTDRHRQLSAARGSVRLSDLQFAAADALSGRAPWLTDIVADFQLRWAEILPPHGAGEVALSSRKVRPVAHALFPPRPPRWAAARQHSPDLLLWRQPNGTTRWVLGEVHLTLNTLESRVFLTQSDVPEALRAATGADMRHGRVVPLYPNTAPHVTSRTYPPLALDPPGEYRYWSYASDEGRTDGAESVPATRLVVAERDGELLATDPSEGWSAPVLEFFGEFVTAMVVNLFQPRAPVPHAPRVALDDLVICRETWHRAARDIPVPSRSGTDAAHNTLRRWAREQGMPRRVFVTVPSEPKPFYVDFHAPLLLENLAQAVRRAWQGAGDTAVVRITEMLPAPEGLWLTDQDGHHFTSEFRVVAVDAHEVPPVVRPVDLEDEEQG
ncbi:hypothetical protein QFZ66_002471 [Streptomyces sp. B4I13]|uniref:lantibiotic dehydratase n=1 Tax=Streptomyces sp. B4I13 TaxID=3042271 RepID=UPI002789380C|nr:lantibiotic dehydratase [Streptomyces sp. B4I13]MDQ0958593.1 hypothetical protein [Streptomyces sp. B4I13]